MQYTQKDEQEYELEPHLDKGARHSCKPDGRVHFGGGSYWEAIQHHVAEEQRPKVSVSLLLKPHNLLAVYQLPIKP